jgi:integrase/recombinase XerD
MECSQYQQTIELWLNCQSSPHTRSCYRRDAARLQNYLDSKPLSAITLADLQGFAISLAAAGLAPISRARTIAAIKSFFGFCTRTRVISFNPATELPLPCYANRLSERILPEDEVQLILGSEMDPRDKTLLNLIYIAGLRVSEATQLRWRNLRARGDAGLITVFGKGGRTRSIPLPPAMWSELTELRQDATGDEPVFPSRTGRLLDRGRVRAIVRQAARHAGIDGDVSPHWLRHAHASHALDHGAPIHLVQATLGHGSVATTSAYLHARPGDSSARFLDAGNLLAESRGLALPLKPTRVMDVIVTGIRGKERTDMKTFTIDAENNISAFASPEEAAAAITNPFESFATEEEMAALAAKWPVARLVEIWNGLAGGKPVKTFKSAKSAASRIWVQIQSLGQPAKPTAKEKAKGRAHAATGANTKGKLGKKATRAKRAPKSAKAAKQAKTGAREGSKTAQVAALLERKGGATLAEIMKATGWQAHSVRGFISGTLAKKMGFNIESAKSEGGDRTYLIAK